MTTYYGDIAPGTALTMKFTTVNTTGAPTGMTSGAVSIYRDNMVTQFTTGVTLTTAFDSLVGHNNVAIVTTNTTNFPVAGGNNFHAVLTGGSVAGVSVIGYVVGSFSTRNRHLGTNAILSTTINTAAITAAKFAAASITSTVINTNAITSNELADGAITSAKFAAGAITAAVIANGAIDAATFAADVDAEVLSYIVDDATRIDASALNTASVTTIPAILEDTGTTLQAEVDGIQADTEDIQSKIGTPAGVSVSADIAAVKSDTAAILVDTGTTLDGKIDTIDTNVDSILADTGTDGVAIATGAISATSFAAGAINAAAIAADAIGSSELAATAAIEIADAFLDRDMSTGTDSGSTTVRTPRQALRALRNKTSINGSTLTVTKEDDATASWTAAVTTAAGNPLTAIDPEGP